MDAEALRTGDLPFEIVADHPGLVRADAEHLHRMGIGPLLGLTETVLAFYLNMIEAMLKRESHHLRALWPGRAVGDERELDAELLQAVERLMSVREHLQFLLVQRLIRVGHGVADRLRRHGMTGDCERHK